MNAARKEPTGQDTNGVQARLKNMEEEAERTRNKIGSLFDSVRGFDRNIATIFEEIRGMVRRMDGHHEKFVEIKNRIDKIDTEGSTMAKLQGEAIRNLKDDLAQIAKLQQIELERRQELEKIMAGWASVKMFVFAVAGIAASLITVAINVYKLLNN